MIINAIYPKEGTYIPEVLLFDGRSIILGVQHEKHVNVSFHPVIRTNISLLRKIAKQGIYYEGETPERVVQQFITKHKLQTVQTRSWEPVGIKLTLWHRLLLDLFGGEFKAILQQIGQIPLDHTLLDALLNNQEWNSGLQPIKEADILRLLELGGINRDVLYKKYNEAKFKAFHEEGMRIAFNEDQEHANSPLHKLEIKANSPRTAALIRSWKSKPGIYFAGAGHITPLYLEDYAHFTPPFVWSQPGPRTARHIRTFYTKWVKVPYRDEEGEFILTSRHFSDKSVQINENTNILKKKYATATIQTLSDNAWMTMKNTNSWKTLTLKQIQQAIVKNQAERNVESVIHEVSSHEVRAPIAIQKADGKYHLIAGNTRLMVARALGVTPKIVVIKTDW